jgi:hypothetical protein
MDWGFVALLVVVIPVALFFGFMYLGIIPPTAAERRRLEAFALKHYGIIPADIIEAEKHPDA